MAQQCIEAIVFTAHIYVPCFYSCLSLVAKNTASMPNYSAHTLPNTNCILSNYLLPIKSHIIENMHKGYSHIGVFLSG